MINKPNNQNSHSSNNSNKDSNKDSSKDSNNSAQNKPQTYKMIKLLGEGAYGKAYLVECISDKVSFNKLVSMCHQNNKCRKLGRKRTTRDC
jgi:hypothetical protein